MNSDFIEKLLAPLNIKLHEGRFKVTPKTPMPNPPFILYKLELIRAHGADDVNLLKDYHIEIELYTQEKDEALMQQIEKALDEQGFEYEAEEDFTEAEELFVKTYEFDITTKMIRSEK